MHFVAEADETPDERTECEPTLMSAKPNPSARQHQGDDRDNLRCEIPKCRRQIAVKKFTIRRIGPGALHSPVIDEIRNAINQRLKCGLQFVNGVLEIGFTAELLNEL